MSKTIWAFIVLMIAHWAEHIVQAYQVWVLHMPRACAMGILGMKYPALMKGEWLHWGFALLTLGFISALNSGFGDVARKWWIAAYWFSLFHCIEHSFLFVQAQTHVYAFGRSEPTSFIQYFIPRIELHLFYNSVITILVSIAMYYKFRKSCEKCLDKSCQI
jgi:hypothetical protein